MNGHDTDNMREAAFRYFDGRQSRDEEKTLFAFMRESEYNLRQFRSWEEEWMEAGRRDHGLDRQWQRLAGRLAASREVPAARRRLSLRRAMSYAAVFVVGLCLSVVVSLLYGGFMRGDAEPALAEYRVPHGSQSQLVLPDGSTVWLNAGSTLRYDTSFGEDERAVYLEGEGVFDVTKNADVPFTVSNERMAVTVHGTVFNVTSFAGDSLSSVDLMEGRVSVSCPFAEAAEELQPGERIVIDNTTRTTRKTTFDVDSYLSWHEGILSFCDEPLADIARKLERRFDLSIRIADEALRGRRYYLTFSRGETIEQILETLGQDPKLHISRKGNIVEIY